MKFQINILLSLALVYCQSIFAQLQLANARDEAMGNSTVACTHLNNIPKNIAIIPGNNKSILECTVSNKYFIKDLSPVYLSFNKSFKNKVAFSTSAGRVGNNSYTEQFFETGIAKELIPKFSAGVKFQFHHWTFTESYYENNLFILPEIGLFANPIKNLNFGVTIRNPVRVRMNATEENNLPAVINPGLSYHVSSLFLLAFSVTQQNDKPLSCQAGAEYNMHQNFSILFGWHTVPVSETFGFMLKLDRFNINMSFQSHPVLGNSSSITINFVL